MHADLCHSHRSQQADLRWTHVCSFSQHTLPSPDVMSYWPATAQLQLHSRATVTFTVSWWLRRVLPDVLARTGLHHDPHLQLLCALQPSPQSADAARRCKINSAGGSLTSSDSRSSSVSSTWTTASAPQGIGAPVVTLITWPGITVWVGYNKHTHTHTVLCRACLVRSLISSYI